MIPTLRALAFAGPLLLGEAAQAQSLNAISDCLFDWGAKNYPNELAASVNPTSATAGEYYYRYYAQSKSYLGISSKDRHFYYMGPSGVPADLGQASIWFAKSNCGSAPPVSSRVRSMMLILTLD